MYLSELLPTNPSVLDSRDMSFGMKSAPDSLLSSIFRSRELSSGSILWVSRGNTDSQICRWYSSLTSSNASPFPWPYYHRLLSRLDSICFQVLVDSLYIIQQKAFSLQYVPQETYSSQINNGQTFFLTISTLLSGMQEYGVPSTGPWLITTLRILFWIYVAMTFSTAVVKYHLLFTGKPLTPVSRSPA